MWISSIADHHIFSHKNNRPKKSFEMIPIHIFSRCFLTFYRKPAAYSIKKQRSGPCQYQPKQNISITWFSSIQVYTWRMDGSESFRGSTILSWWKIKTCFGTEKRKPSELKILILFLLVTFTKMFQPQGSHEED